jgi:hypothetical protein
VVWIEKSSNRIAALLHNLLRFAVMRSMFVSPSNVARTGQFNRAPSMQEV